MYFASIERILAVLVLSVLFSQSLFAGAPSAEQNNGVNARPIKKSSANFCVKMLSNSEAIILMRNEINNVFKDIAQNSPDVIKKYLLENYKSEAVRLVFPNVNGAKYEVLITPLNRDPVENDWVYRVQAWADDSPVYNLDMLGHRNLLTGVFEFETFFYAQRKAIEKKYNIKNFHKVLRMNSGITPHIEWNMFYTLGYSFNVAEPEFWFLQNVSKEANARLHQDRHNFYSLLKQLEDKGLHLTIEQGHVYVDRGPTELFRKTILRNFETEAGFHWRMLLKELAIFLHNLED